MAGTSSGHRINDEHMHTISQQLTRIHKLEKENQDLKKVVDELRVDRDWWKDTRLAEIERLQRELTWWQWQTEKWKRREAWQRWEASTANEAGAASSEVPPTEAPKLD